MQGIFENESNKRFIDRKVKDDAVSMQIKRSFLEEREKWWCEHMRVET
jgi:hypothetical protein